MTTVAPEAVTEVSEELEPRELWKYRELLYFLTWRDTKVRYKQTVLGATKANKLICIL